MVSKRNRTGAISSDEASALFVDFDFWRSEVSIAACANADDIAAANTLVRRRDLTLRGPDALHIALAQRLNATLLTFDKNMAAAARDIGLALAIGT